MYIFGNSAQSIPCNKYIIHIEESEESYDTIIRKRIILTSQSLV